MGAITNIATSRKGTYISTYRRMITSLLDDLQTLRDMRQEMDAINLGAILTDADFTGENAGLVKQDLVDAAQAAAVVYALIDPATNPTTAGQLFKVKI